METRTADVPTIHCGHCTHTIENELAELAGVESVDADVASRKVTVTYGPPATWTAIADLLREIGYPPAE